MSGFNHWGELADKLPAALQHGIDSAAQEVESRIAGNSPYDTGFLRSSVYRSTPESSDYGSASAPPGDSYLLPEEKPPDDMSAVIGVGASYGIYLEYGTRNMPAQPYVTPQTEAARSDALNLIAKALAEGLTV